MRGGGSNPHLQAAVDAVDAGDPEALRSAGGPPLRAALAAVESVDARGPASAMWFLQHGEVARVPRSGYILGRQVSIII